MSWNFDSIPKYVINLDKRKDRWQQFESVPGREELHNLRRWPAIDGKTINLDTDTNVALFTKYNIIRGIRRSHKELNSKGGVGCYLSHVGVWRDFLENPEHAESPVALILEDDTIMDSVAISRINVFIKSSSAIQNSELWDVCILGAYPGHIKHEPLYQDDPNCIRLMEFQGMTGYLITKKGVAKTLPQALPIQGHIDWFLSICAQMQYIDLCCPLQSLIGIRISKTDIHKTISCDICDLEPDFIKDKTVISNTRLRMFLLEEFFLVVVTAFFISKKYMKS